MIEQGYDRLGSRYFEWTTSQGPGVREWFLDEVLQRLPVEAVVLELGCGPGTVSAALADGRHYTGVDLSAGQLVLARERLPDANFIQADFTNIELPSGAFDAVVAFFVFNHLPRAEHAPMFERVWSWLRPGGRFMLSLGASDTHDEVEAGNEAAAPTATAVLEHVVSSIVDDADAVRVEALPSKGRIKLQVKVGPGDLGRVIGRRGRTAQSIRTVVRAAATRDGVEVDVDFVDD